MAQDKVFPKGISFNTPREGAPDFVKGRIGIKLEEAIPFLQNAQNAGNEWLNLDLLIGGKSGKPYLAVDTYALKTGNEKPVTQAEEEGLPF